MAIVGTSTTTASTAIFQSKQHAKYRSGFGGNERFTASHTSPVAATEQYIGLADETGSSAAFNALNPNTTNSVASQTLAESKMQTNLLNKIASKGKTTFKQVSL